VGAGRTFALIQQIEALATSQPLVYDVCRDLRQAINNETARVQGGTATLVSGRATIQTRGLVSGAQVQAWYAVEDPTTVAGDALSCPPTLRVPGKQFVIVSSNSSDASAVEWLVVNP